MHLNICKNSKPLKFSIENGDLTTFKHSLKAQCAAVPRIIDHFGRKSYKKKREDFVYNLLWSSFKNVVHELWPVKEFRM